MEEEKADSQDSSTMDTDDFPEEETTNFEHVNAVEDFEDEQSGNNSVDPFELTQEEEEASGEGKAVATGEEQDDSEDVEFNILKKDGEAKGDKETELIDLNEGFGDELKNLNEGSVGEGEDLPEESVGEREDLNNLNEESVDEREHLSNLNEESVDERENLNSLNEESVDEREGLNNLNEKSASEREDLNNLNDESVDEREDLNDLNEEEKENSNNSNDERENSNNSNDESVTKRKNLSNLNEECADEGENSNNSNDESVAQRKNLSNLNEECVDEGENSNNLNEECVDEGEGLNNLNKESVDLNEEGEIDLHPKRQRGIAEDVSSEVVMEKSDSIAEKRSVVVGIQNVEVSAKCSLCDRMLIVKFNYTESGKKKYVCSDQCLEVLKRKIEDVRVEEPFKKFFIAPTVSPMYRHNRVCRQCATTIVNSEGVISWEAMDFCKESCLYRFQVAISKACAECGNTVAYSQIGKYAVRFGCIVRQFCSGHCLETKKKKIRICSFCQKSIKRTKTTIGNKYFCDETCKGMYENLQQPKRPPYLANPDDIDCFVCKEFKDIKIEFSYHGKSHYFCSPECFTVFKFIQCCDYNPKKCHTCFKYVFQQYLEKHALYYDNIIHYFCSETCQHIYVITNRRVVPCLWCKVKKYNFDMIQKSNYLESTIYMCSIYCLNQFNASIKAAFGSKKKCHMCEKPGLYELIIGGNRKVMAAFCSNNCINVYRLSRPKVEPPRRGRGRKQVIPDKPGPLPVIANVVSLANSPQSNSFGGDELIKKLVIVKDEDPPEVTNVSTMVYSEKHDRETQIFAIDNESKDTQTDFEKEIQTVPIMVPIYIPAPFPMWSAPVPKPIPFPLVIPCPVLIPTTKKTSQNVLKEVGKESVNVDDPFEAELLMMAELVAAEKKEETPALVEENPTEETAHPDHEDLIVQTVPPTAVDLEGALEPAIIRPTINERKHEEDIPRELQRGSSNSRGRRRGRTPGKRGRRPANYSTVREVEEPEPELLPREPIEKPDAHMCLKYTFGANAWKQWVTSKNADLERSSCNLKLIKTELLQLTADELNYTLCLFVKEVRKPNGSEYAPDTIYYLCLGIQQYLYENGRIDNIFCDPYFEQFTECLHEICVKFSALYNDAHYIVTRVEEEHLWECKQLGAHSPHVLLFTLMFFNTKYFNLTNADEHLELSFTHIMKHWKGPKEPNSPKTAGGRNVLLRFYPPQSVPESRKKKVYEQEQNAENPLRCPVKLYEFYLLKCPESVKTRSDVFYLQPERSCVPDSPVWYSTMPMQRAELEKMLYRVKMVKEVNVALLTN